MFRIIEVSVLILKLVMIYWLEKLFVCLQPLQELFGIWIYLTVYRYWKTRVEFWLHLNER